MLSLEVGQKLSYETTPAGLFLISSEVPSLRHWSKSGPLQLIFKS